ncbi:MAG: TRAP transporter small permease [Pseudomonadota bacterium]
MTDQLIAAKVIAMEKAGFKSVWNAVVKLSAGLNAVGAFGVFLIMVFVFSDVVGRNFFNSPITGVPEIVKVGVVMFTFMGVPWALRTNRHIRSDLIPGRLGTKGQEIMSLIRHLFFMGVCICIMIATWGPMIKSWQILEYEGEGSLHVPVYPLFTLIQLGCILAAIIALSCILQNIKNMRRLKTEG